VRYLRDTLFMEHIKTVPALLFRDKQGDCDDIATAVAAMLLTIGVPVRLEAVGFNPVEGYSHVFTAAYDSSTLGWLAVDPVAAARTQTMLTKVKHRLVKVVR
jgi:transglutaminase-like putative cysteine protease